LLLGFVYNDSRYVGPVTPAQQAQCPAFIREVCGMARKDEFVIQYTLLNMGLGLIAIAGALKVFGEYVFLNSIFNCDVNLFVLKILILFRRERVTYWRESTTGTR
jgi:hypothetical protein